MSSTRPPLDYALLGLLNQRPLSGYALRRVFLTTALGMYSDSPGSIYPALRRLEAQRLVRGTAEEDARRRRTYRITAAGRQALGRWLQAPTSYEEVAASRGGPELRLAFLSDFAPPAAVASFLMEYAALLERRLAELTAVRASVGSKFSLSAALALEGGITFTRARAAWCRRAAAGLAGSP